MRHMLRPTSLQQHPHEARRPRMTRMRAHRIVQRRMSRLPLLRGHAQPVVNRCSDAAQVPRVHEQRFVHRARDAHEFREDEGSWGTLFALRVGLGLDARLREHELHTRRVHAVAEGGDEREVRCAQ